MRASEPREGVMAAGSGAEPADADDASPPSGGSDNLGAGGSAHTPPAAGMGGAPPGSIGDPETIDSPPMDSAGAPPDSPSAGAAGDGGNPSETPSESPFPASVTAPRIMIVGDSISAGPGCYKKYLLQALQDNGYSKFEFVGEYDDDCGGGVRHSAVSCSTSRDFTQPTFTLPNCFADDTFPGMAELVASHAPDLILLQLGVNDVWSGSAPIQPILDNYGTLVEQARSHNPNIVVVMAQIHQIITDGCSNAKSTENALELVEAVPAYAAALSTPESPIFVADLWTNSDPHEADDCVHPNDAGAQRMGGNWYEALKSILPQ